MKVNIFSKEIFVNLIDLQIEFLFRHYNFFLFAKQENKYSELCYS